LTINGETLQAMNLDDACRYLKYWGTRNGDMRATKEVVRQKIIAARDLIKCHSLTPELATELFTSKGIGVFRFSAALIEWSGSESNDVKRLCVQAYKNAWHLLRSTASALFIFPKTHAGKESTLPMAVLTQELLLHAKRCMRHEDVSKKIMLAGLNRTKDKLIQPMEAALNQPTFLTQAKALIGKAISKHATQRNAEVKSIINKDRQVAPKWMPLGLCLAVNTHNMGGRFVESVKNAQWSMSSQEAGDGLESIVKFQVQIKGHNQREYEDKWQGWQNWTDKKLTTKLTKDDQQPVLLLPARWWSETLPEFDSGRWWQRPHKRARCRQCKCSLVENPSFKSSKCHRNCISPSNPC